jgi:hypothetical protein
MMDSDEKYFAVLLSEKKLADKMVGGYADLGLKVFGMFGVGGVLLSWLFTTGGGVLSTSIGVACLALAVASCGIVAQAVSTYSLTLGYVQYRNEYLNEAFTAVLRSSDGPIRPIQAVARWRDGAAILPTTVSTTVIAALHAVCCVALLLVAAVSFRTTLVAVIALVFGWLALVAALVTEGALWRAMTAVFRATTQAGSAEPKKGDHSVEPASGAKNPSRGGVWSSIIRAFPFDAHKLFYDLLWPGAAGSIGWAVAQVALESDPYSSRAAHLVALSLLGIYFIIDWLRCWSLPGPRRPGLYWIFDALHLSSLVALAIAVQTRRDEPLLEVLLAVVFVVVVFGHGAGAWDTSKQITGPWLRLALASCAFIGVAILAAAHFMYRCTSPWLLSVSIGVVLVVWIATRARIAIVAARTD